MSKKAIMLSIRPEWVEKILSGEKTIEVRKTRPKIGPPFKCYIYCTRPRYEYEDYFLVIQEGGDGFISLYGGQKVVGEFVCDEIMEDLRGEYADKFERYGCLPLEDQKAYGKNKPLYGWHISGLKIYDEPKELSDFKRHDPTYDFAVFGEINRTYSIRRPPQSWCYVEEKDDE